ncbi:hypothetical protein GP475_08695 [Corynebacterium poyangense]|uniref:Uncharacterized protein n=1 Tax=Corynebacterium poyangense TaxID=2684405 RepID=A0A7H0SQ81_9CORY|nr:hypothetical protein [Corynebacterium poyangense]QNQ90706.1 hypothetical protein GP475_08695 [Corynebacterium poyangense]
MSLRGDWRPGLPAPVSRLVIWLLALEILDRGVDYALGDPPGVTNSLTIVEEAMPLPAWGALCLIAGITVIVGILTKQHVGIVLGSLWAAGIYAALSWGLFLKFLERGEPWSGWRTPVHFLMMAGVWALIAVGTTWRRRLDREYRERGTRA